MTTFAAMPLRYSADPAAMIRFLTHLGMARVVTAGADNFATLTAGGGGSVMVHSVHGADATVTPGETVLCFATEDADEAAAQLDGMGVEVAVWDESYGRQAMAVSPSGGAVWINEEMTDLYGYAGHQRPATDPRLVVAAIVPTVDFGADRAFFERFGFTSDPGANEWWEEMRSDGGVVGLHRPEEGWVALTSSDDPRYRYPRIHLGFQTSAPLEEVRDHLAAGGYPAEIVRVPEATKVHVTDPDGQVLEIHPVP